MKEIEAAHGDYPGGRVAVVGMGKLGSLELTAGSDVDIILLYDYDDDGRRIRRRRSRSMRRAISPASPSG